ncbi:unnamed protein product, partial [Nesidiocoris tenuis]
MTMIPTFPGSKFLIGSSLASETPDLTSMDSTSIMCEKSIESQHQQHQQFNNNIVNGCCPTAVPQLTSHMGNSDTNAIDISFGTTKTPSLDTIRYNQWKATVRRHGKDLSMESSAVPLPSYIVGVGSVADWPMRSPLLFTGDVTLVCPWAGEENGLTRIRRHLGTLFRPFEFCAIGIVETSKMNEDELLEASLKKAAMLRKQSTPCNFRFFEDAEADSPLVQVKVLPSTPPSENGSSSN